MGSGLSACGYFEKSDTNTRDTNSVSGQCYRDHRWRPHIPDCAARQVTRMLVVQFGTISASGLPMAPEGGLTPR
jgi:hypothetical protein